MKTRLSLLSMIGVSAVLGVAASISAIGPVAGEDSGPKAVVGKPAPDFTLQDASGKEYRLSDYEGKIVVLQWINPDCPVCRGCMKKGVVTAMRKEIGLLEPGIVHLAINSTHYQEAKKGAEYLKEYKIDIPALSDRDGTVGHLYGAKTTPQLFIIDEEGILRYNGAIDNARMKTDSAPMNYVVNAVRQLTIGETIAPDQTTPYGCSVKFKK